jgi:hypothetical protein
VTSHLVADAVAADAQGPRLTSRASHSEIALLPDTCASRSLQERFEFKYWIPERLAPAVGRCGRSYLRVDPYHDANAMQRNTSLYLDTPSLGFYDAHVESSADRLKLRVRVYGEKPAGLAFFELKRKVRSVVVKSRAAVPLDSVAAILTGDYAALPRTATAEETRHLQAFLYDMTVHRAEPAFLVTCRREAYASLHEEDDVRLTVDRDIAYQRARGPHFETRERDWVYLGAPPGIGSERMALVELKFRGMAPLWMGDLVRRLEAKRVSYSKYVTSVRMETEERPAALAVASSIWI